MEIRLKKVTLVLAMLTLAPALSGCKTTSDERLMYGTFVGAGIGAGIGAIGGGSVLPGAVAGAFVGAIVTTVIE